MVDNKGIAKAVLPFYGAFGFSVASFVFMIVGFSSPYWLESFSTTRSGIQRAGIWSVCFDRFTHNHDQNVRVYNGCYWILNRNLINLGIWDWLNTRWMTAVQVLITAAFIGQCAQMISMILYYLYLGHPLAESSAACFLHCGSAVLQTCGLIAFGVGYQDRIWANRPDFTHLSWSYGFVLLSAICSVLAACYLYCVARSDFDLQQEYVLYENYEHYLAGTVVGPYAGQGVGGAPRSVISVPQAPSRGGGKEIYLQGMSTPVARSLV